MTPSLLCETVTGTTMADLIAARDAVTGADMVELRIDGVRDVDVARALQGRRVPAIVTCRPSWEGGRFNGAEEERRRVLAEALEQGAEYVDIEWRSLRVAGGAGLDDLLERHPERVIVSSHDFDGVPGDLARQVSAMRRSGPAVIKVAMTPARLSDTLVLRDIGRDGAAVVIGMGDAGMATRLLASRFGSRWTYGGKGAVPGQVPVARMLEGFRFRSVGAQTALYGVVGTDAVGSLVPAMHNAAFAAEGLDAVCVPLPADDFDDFSDFADAMGFAGAVATASFTLGRPTVPVRFDERSARLGAATAVRRTTDGWEATYIGAREPVGAPGAQGHHQGRVAEVEQQFAFWTGCRASAEVMRAAARAEARSLGRTLGSEA
jgi:3-dehydroquinate dehydratase/shikimate dehydrogenase